MRYLFGFLCVCALGVAPSPQSARAQAGEEAATSEPSLQEPSSEPAPEEPALQLKLDSAGVEVVPSPPPTVDGYTLEEMELRVRRARIGLITSTPVFAVGIVLFSVGAANLCITFCPEGYPRWADPVLWTGFALMGAGFYGMVISGAMLGVRKRKLRGLRQAHYGTPRRVQWDLAQSRLVF